MQGLKQINFNKEGKRLCKDYLLLIVGAFVMAFAYSLFFIPYDIAPGGVTGIATILWDITGLPVGFLSFLINLPLFLIGFRNVGWRFALRSFVATSLLSFFIDLIPIRDLTGNIMLSAVFGGVILGIGLGLVVRSGSTTGGTDMAASILHRRVTFLTVPAILMAIDAIVVILAGIRFGIGAAFYALVACYVSTRAMDLIIKGFNTAVQTTIITREKEKIIPRILSELNRGCTEIEATGTYTGKPVGMLMCVISKVEVAKLKKIVNEEDPSAFVTICDVHEALGEGFSTDFNG